MAWRSLGWVYLNMENYYDAVYVLKKALAIDRDNAITLNELAWSYYKLKLFKKTIKYGQKAVEQDNESKEAWDTLVCGYFGLGKYAKAREAMKKVKKIDPNFVGTSEIYDQLKAMSTEAKRKATIPDAPARSLDTEVEKIAATLAQKNKFRHVSLRKVADESGISIIEVSRILSESKIGEIETYDTDTLEDDVFILDIPEWSIENPLIEGEKR